MKRLILAAVLVLTTIFTTLPVQAETNYPVIKLTKVSEQQLSTNEAYNLTLKVKNMGNGYGKDVALSLWAPKDSPIVITEQLASKAIGKINPGVSFDLTYSLRVKSGAAEGHYPLTLKGTYVSADGQVQKHEEIFNIQVVKGNNEPDFEITVAQGQQIHADSEKTQRFVLNNRGTGAGEDVTVKFSDQNTTGVHVTGDKDRYLATVTKGGQSSFEMPMVIAKTIKGYTPVKFDVTYTTKNLKTTKTITTHINVLNDLKEGLQIQEIRQNNSTLVPGQQATYTVVVKNTGNKALDNVQVSYNQQGAYVPVGSSVRVIERLVAGAEEAVTFTIRISKGAKSQSYPIDFKAVKGTLTSTMSAGVSVLNEKMETKPRIVVENMTVSADKIYSGDAFSLSFKAKNSSTLKGIRNLKVLLKSNDTIVSATPSSSVFVGDLATGGSAPLTMNLKALASSEGGNQAITLNFEYEDADGKQHTDSEVLNIPVYVKNELTVSDVRFGAVTSSSYKLAVDFYNTGKIQNRNLMVDIKGDFETKNSNYFVGNFAAGRSDIYEVTITGQPAEKVSGTVIFTYDDTFGEKVTLEKPFEITYAPKTTDDMAGAMGGDGMTANAMDTGMAMDGSMEGGMAPQPTSKLPLYGGIAAAAVALFILFRIIQKRKADA